jgi:hypothetical protein
MFVVFDLRTHTAISVARYESKEPHQVSFPVEHERYIALVDDPFSLKNQVLVPDENGFYTMVEMQNLTERPQMLHPLPKFHTADVELQLRQGAFFLEAISRYPKEKVHKFSVCKKGNPFEPYVQFKLAVRTNLLFSELVTDYHLTHEEWSACSFYLEKPYAEFTYCHQLLF